MTTSSTPHRTKITLVESVSPQLAAQVEALHIQGVTVTQTDVVSTDAQGEEVIPCTVSINPVEVVGVQAITSEKQQKLMQYANDLSHVLDLDADEVYEKITDTSKSQYVLARQITLEKASEVRQLGINGISINEDVVRAYPMGAFLTQVLGSPIFLAKGRRALKKA